MIARNDILQFLSANKQFIKEKYLVSKIALFGSYARGENTELSDIDILFEFDENIRDVFQNKFELREYLKATFQREIDLCREKALRDPFRSFILKEAIYV